MNCLPVHVSRYMGVHSDRDADKRCSLLDSLRKCHRSETAARRHVVRLKGDFQVTASAPDTESENLQFP